VASLRSQDAAALNRHRMKDNTQLDEEMAKLARTQWKVEYVSFQKNLCGPQASRAIHAWPEDVSDCTVYGAVGVPMQFDNHHLTVQGSELFARSMRERGQMP
jgi:hypothetical protein